MRVLQQTSQYRNGVSQTIPKY